MDVGSDESSDLPTGFVDVAFMHNSAVTRDYLPIFPPLQHRYTAFTVLQATRRNDHQKDKVDIYSLKSNIYTNPQNRSFHLQKKKRYTQERKEHLFLSKSSSPTNHNHICTVTFLTIDDSGSCSQRVHDTGVSWFGNEIGVVLESFAFAGEGRWDPGVLFR